MADSERLICAADAVQEQGTGVRFEIDRTGLKQNAFVIRFKGAPRAFLNQCGHVPVELDWQEGEFFDDTRLYLICSTHGALYDPVSGRCISGRCAGRGLIPLPVNEHNGNIYLTQFYLTEPESNHD
ncbi:MAG: Rieske 2Fe-2S domain-containing protein [Thiobacillaceae bacterium]